jgi:hypothetical protein
MSGLGFVGRSSYGKHEGVLMRITTDQTIAGYPALQVRKLMRETVGRSITLRYVREILRCSDVAATRVLNRLKMDGFVEPVKGHFEPTIKGSALAMATAAPPLRRGTAARLIAGLAERVRALNADEKWAYRVGMVVVFGSYVRGVDRPNDVDIACELRPRWTGEMQRAQEQVRREIRGKPFRNMSDWATWPKLEVIRFLKTRSRGLSIHELEDWILQTPDHEVLLGDGSKTAEMAQGVERQHPTTVLGI